MKSLKTENYRVNGFLFLAGKNYRAYKKYGNIKEVGRYKNGEKTGKWISYGYNGQYEKGRYKKGKKVRSWKSYDYKNNLFIKRILDSKVEIKKVIGYDNGKKQYQYNYKNRLKTGLCKTYHENGKIHSKGYYFKDKKIGLWKYYNENGKLEKTQTFANNAKPNWPANSD